MSTDKHRRLGRGLGALLSTHQISTPAVDAAGLDSAESDAEPKRDTLQRIPLDRIKANTMQPRREFATGRLEELAASLRTNGLLQPISVRRVGSGFELIAGERRLRAAQRLGWTEIPALVRDDRALDDQSMLALALVENLQRTDLNPIEEAEGYQKLVAEFAMTQQQVADTIGKERSTVANLLRLLALPESIRDAVRKGTLTVGHARALLAVTNPAQLLDLAKITIAESLSVREVERRVRALTPNLPGHRARPLAAPLPQTAALREIEASLRKRFQTDSAVRLTSGNSGDVRLAFYSADDLERLLDLLLGANRHEL